MKYIDADRLTAKIDNAINVLKKDYNPNPKGPIREALAYVWIEAFEQIKDTIDEMAQEVPTAPVIEDEH